MEPQQPSYAVPQPSLVGSDHEQVVFNLRRHPIGILGIYIASAIMLILVAVGAFGLVPRVLTSVPASKANAIAGAIFFVVMFLVLGFVYIAHIVYWSNTWQLTFESLTQTDRNSLFDQQLSHLSLGNVQDVSSEQDGIVPHLFNYGVLTVETAGERSKFQFPYCPRPEYYAQQILEARERFEQGRATVNNGVSPQIPTQPTETGDQPPYQN